MSDTPSPGTPHPDDKNPQTGPPEQSERPLTDRLFPEEAGPASGPGYHDPDPITEQVLFDDLLPPELRGSQPPPADPDDALADLPPPAGPTGPGSGWLEEPPAGGAAPATSPYSVEPQGGSDVFSDPRSGGPGAHGSSVFGEELLEGSDVFRTSPGGPTRVPGSSIFELRPDELAAADTLGGSDILSAPPDATPPADGSDVLQRITDPDATSSNIFDSHPEGSGRFEDPAEATEPVTQVRTPPPADPLRPASDVFDTHQPASEVFGDPQPTDAENSGVRDGLEPEFGTPPAGRGRAPETEEEVIFEDSGVDLLNPEEGVEHDEPEASASSIFNKSKAGDGSELDVPSLASSAEDDEATESIHPLTRPIRPPSDLFEMEDAGTGDHERVSFELSDHDPVIGPEAEPSQQVSGMIDWTVPVEGADLPASSRMTDSEATEAGIPDLQTAETPPPTPTPTPGPVRRPPSTIPDMGLTERSRPSSRAGSNWSIHDIPAPQPPARSGRAGLLAGLAVGLLVGAGGFAAAYFGNLLPDRSGAPPRQVGQLGSAGGSSARTPGLDEARTLLAAGDPAAALRAYEAAGDLTAPEDRAGRGQARWLVRVRELASQGAAPTADDPQLREAAADLQAAVDAAGELRTPEQQRAGVLAALHLGLIKEMTASPAEARRHYLAVQGQFPGYGRAFQAALHRLQIAPATPPKKTAQLTPREAEELAQLAVIATVLLQAPAGAAADDDEPGFHFWEACQLNSSREYLKAADAILRARAAHESRRLKLAGQGLNPLSDPLEQMFFRACTEIREYWVLKHHFYGHKSLGEEMRTHAQKGTFPNFLSEVVTLREEIKKGGGEKLAQLQAALDRATQELQTASSAATKAMSEKEAATKALDAARKSLDDQAKQLADAQARLTAAEKRQRAADEALAGVVKELRAAKLIDETDDAAAAVAKLPEVVRKASTAAASADARKAAEALAEAKKEADAARAEAERAGELARKAADEAKTLRDRLDTEVKKATDAATADARRKLDELAAALTRTRQDYEARLAAKDEEHRRQLTDARAGMLTPLTSAEVAARERAAHTYDAGVELFFARRYAEAEAALARATDDNPTDARYWYYLGLARYAQGKPAGEELKKGAELEARNQPARRTVNRDLERLPGAYRQLLSQFRP
jgi:hypothetical protein